MKKRYFVSAILFILILTLISASFSSCSKNNAEDDDVNGETKSNAEISETTTENPFAKYDDNLGEYNFKGEEFKIQTFEDVNIHNRIDTEEEIGELLNDAIYKRNRTIEERFNVVIKEILVTNYSHDKTRSIMLSGDSTAFDLFSARCSDALSAWQEGLAYSYEDIPAIDLSKPYWNQTMNKSITLGGNQYVALGDFNLNTYDITHTMLFNKSMIQDFELEDPYSLVNSGKWTLTMMEEMIKQVILDLDGDGIMNEYDRYGYLAGPKQVLPCFWIAANTLSIGKDENDIPYIAMGDENFVRAFDKTFSMLWDSGAYYLPKDTWADVPPEARNMFSNGQSLFMDMTFIVIESMRSTETDFGILPYPKYDENQENYVSRTEYYWTFQVPSINNELERAGVMLEALNSYSAKIVIPAYYELALKTKFTRDDESSEMLDLILSTTVIDLGDTILCGDIRDGIMKPMFEKNDRNLISKVQKTETTIKKFIENIPVHQG